jgi:DNA-binding NarL/FixJ family response regulator
MTSDAPAAVRCLIADDHPAVLAAVADFVSEHGVTVTARARDGEEAAMKIERTRPAVALLDIRMPRLSGVEVANRVARTAPETAVVLYTGFGDQALLADALDAGIRGFVLKEAPLADLVRAIETVAAGGIYVDPVLGGAIAIAQAAKGAPQLTDRERDVLRLLADGHSNERIGERLIISPETVRTHVRKAMIKLAADTRTQAVAIALRRQLIA